MMTLTREELRSMITETITEGLSVSVSASQEERSCSNGSYIYLTVSILFDGEEISREDVSF